MWHPIKMFQKWTEKNEKNLKWGERITSGVLFVSGIIIIIFAYLLQSQTPFWYELLRDIGFACFVAVIIKYINEVFLSRRIMMTFEKQRREIKKDVLYSTFEKLIPNELFAEIKKTVFSDLHFMRDQYLIAYNFKKNEEGKIVVITHVHYRIENLLKTATDYRMKWGLELSDKWKKTFNDISYNFGNSKKKTSIPLDELQHEFNNNFGNKHEQTTFNIPYIEVDKPLHINTRSETLYEDIGIRSDEIRQYFLEPTSGVQVRVCDVPDNVKMNFKIQQLGSGEFVESKDSSSDKHVWVYNGCFYPYHGYILSWEIV